jgi:uncharacterized protein (TIGR02646 family)
VWQRLKPYLSKVMDGKCWYCETKDARSDNAVDHFRPKSLYWRLALQYNNFRFSCTYCNSRRLDSEYGTEGGKQDNFPLLAEEDRAHSPNHPIGREGPVLLDPCNYGDPQLIWFDETGLPSVNPRYEAQRLAQARLKASVILYHLDHAPLVAARRRKFLEVHRRGSIGDEEYQRYETAQDFAALNRWSLEVVAVYRLIDRSTEHSSAARCAVLGLRTRSKTAQEALAVT